MKHRNPENAKIRTLGCPDFRQKIKFASTVFYKKKFQYYIKCSGLVENPDFELPDFRQLEHKRLGPN